MGLTRAWPGAGYAAHMLYAIAGATLIALVPKNYLFLQGLSAQVLLNPLILGGAALAVVVLALSARPPPVAAAP